MRPHIPAAAILIAGAAIFTMGSSAPSLALALVGADQIKRVGAANAGLVQKVHGWHCSRRYGWVGHRHRRRWHSHRRWHRHRRACYSYYNYRYDYGPYIYYSIPRYYRRGRIFRRGPRFHRGPTFRPGRAFRGGRSFRRGTSGGMRRRGAGGRRRR